jgi:3-hydroxyisobutyrate dehydrogenase-like beta-hydroxyacid dehydrogenase
MSSKVSILGMGQMGSGMARRLIASGHDVLGYDINTQTRQALRKEGLAMADGVQEAVSGRGIILTSLPNPASVREAWTGDAGLVELAEEGSLVIELSTIDPNTMKEVGAAAVARGLQVIDCPVSGSPTEAADGKLVLITGGEEAAIKSAEPILSLLGGTSRHTGPVGTAKVVKIVNNMMSMANVVAASEAFALGVAAGVEPEKLFEVLSVSGGRSHHFLKRFPNVLANDYQPGFKMELGEKDLALAIDFGRATHIPTPAASMARELMATALAEGYRGQDIVAVHDMYRRWAAKGAEQ